MLEGAEAQRVLDLLREEGERFASRLDEAGVAVHLHRVEGRDHYFLDPGNVVAELDLTMALTGCRTLADITRDRLVRAPATG